MSKILVIAEHLGGKLNSSTARAVSAAAAVKADAIDVQALGLMLADAARMADRGLRIPAEASMVKQFGLEAVGRVTDRALLVHGGIGYTRKLPIERLYRDARLNWLEEGTPTIQYLVTAGQLIDGYQLTDPFSRS